MCTIHHLVNYFWDHIDDVSDDELAFCFLLTYLMRL